jgi:hypothetical protein
MQLMLLSIEEIEDNVKGSSMQVIEWYFGLDLRHFFGDIVRPFDIMLYGICIFVAICFF